jgi:hypothetical protein
MFEFDRELFISKVYEKALRGSLKNTVENMRREQQQPYVILPRKKETGISLLSVISKSMLEN